MADKEYLGKDLYAAWVYSGGTVTLSGEQRTFTWAPNVDFIELQAGSDATRRRHEHLKDWTMTIEWTAQSDGTALITALAEGTRGTLTFGDAGTAVGRPRLVAEGVSQGITRNAPYSDIVMYSLSIVGDGAAQDAIYDWYVDSVSGSDSNDGKYPTTPFLTIAKLLTEMGAGESAALAKGSTWNETLTIPGAGCTVAAYGTGARPIIDCRDSIATGDWSKSGGYTNIYQVTKTIDTGITDPFIHIWVDGEMLTNVASLAACDAAAGSYYVAAHNASPVTIYVHSTGSTNPASDSKVYKYNPRYSSLYAQLLDNQTVTGIHTIGNLAGAGSLVVGKNSVVTDCYVEDGGKHNSVAGSGTSFTDCTFDGGHMGNNVAILLTINSDTPASEGVNLTRCTFTLPSITVPHWAYLLAISSHYNVSGSFGTITLTDCSLENFSGSMSTFNHASAVNIVNPTFTNCKFGFFPPQTTCDMTVTGGSWTSTITNQRMMDASYANAGTLTIDGMTINANGTTDTGYVSVRAACVVVVKNCTFKANINGTGGAPIYCSSATANLTIGGAGQGNILNTGTGYWGYSLYFAAGAAGMTLTADYNSYEATNDQWYIFGTNYTDLATYQAAVAPNDANSTST